MIKDLSKREREILVLKANGNTDGQIARHLGISPNTVSSTLARAYRKLHATTAAQAVAIAIAIGEMGVHQIAVPDWDDISEVERDEAA